MNKRDAVRQAIPRAGANATPCLGAAGRGRLIHGRPNVLSRRSRHRGRHAGLVLGVLERAPASLAVHVDEVDRGVGGQLESGVSPQAAATSMSWICSRAFSPAPGRGPPDLGRFPTRKAHHPRNRKVRSTAVTNTPGPPDQLHAPPGHAKPGESVAVARWHAARRCIWSRRPSRGLPTWTPGSPGRRPGGLHRPGRLDRRARPRPRRQPRRHPNRAHRPPPQPARPGHPFMTTGHRYRDHSQLLWGWGRIRERRACIERACGRLAASVW